MDSGTPSEPFVAVALWLGVAALCATAALLLSAAFLRYSLVRRLARERRLAATWNPLLAECAERVPESVPALAARDAPAVLLLWVRAQESLRGEAQERLVLLAARFGASAHAQRLLRGRHLPDQLLALIVLGHLRERSVIPLLELLVPAAPSVISLTAAQALVRVDPARGLPRLLANAGRREDWPLDKVLSILRECDPAQVSPVLSAALQGELKRAAAGPSLGRLLKLRAAAHDEALRPAVLALLEAGAGDEAISGALGALWHPQDVAHARRLAAHQSWIVRVAAARTLGRLGGREDFERLAALLSDPAWWVRYRAAQALCSLPGIAPAELAALAGRLQDRFASDILAQAQADRAAA